MISFFFSFFISNVIQKNGCTGNYLYSSPLLSMSLFPFEMIVAVPKMNHPQQFCFAISTNHHHPYLYQRHRSTICLQSQQVQAAMANKKAKKEANEACN